MLQPFTGEFVGAGESFASLCKFIDHAVSGTEPVMLLGEPGTGKEVAARMIHFSSRRKNHPFLSVDPSLYYEQELERELFGHVEHEPVRTIRRGILEFSSRGTCYIANVEELSLAVQERLLSLVSTGEFSRVGCTESVNSNARLIVSSGKNLRGLAEGGLFSRKLFDQFGSLIREIPPLRSRCEDVLPFVNRTAKCYSVETGTECIGFTEDAISALGAYPWPGNYDELKAELLSIFKSGIRTVTGDCLSPEIIHYWIGREGAPLVRKVIEELEMYLQEFRIMMRLDAEYGEVLLERDEWDLELKCYDRVT